MVIPDSPNPNPQHALDGSSPLPYPSSSLRSSPPKDVFSSPSSMKRLPSTEPEMSSPLHFNVPSSSSQSFRYGDSTGRRRNDILGSVRRNQREVTLTPRRPGENSEFSEGPEPMIIGETATEAMDPMARTVVWGTDINVSETMEKFKMFIENYLDKNSGKKFYEPVLAELRVSQEKYMNLDCSHILEFDPVLYKQIINYPQEIIPLFDLVIGKLVYDDEDEAESNPIQVRTYNLNLTTNMRDLNPEDIDKLICIKGMVIRCSNLIPELKSAMFECSLCNYNTVAEIDRGRIEEPLECANCKNLKTMRLIHNRSIFADKQCIKLQETPEVIPAGQTPHTVLLYSYDSLVDFVQPGDRIQVTGVYRAASLRINSLHRTLKSVFKSYIDVIHFKKQDSKHIDKDGPESDEFSVTCEEACINPTIEQERIARLKQLASNPNIYDILTRALAPGIWELDDVKKGLLCQLFGGTNKHFSEQSRGRFRGDINILLCGDPGTSKSQLLQYVHKIAPRSIYTSGKGSSSVGLTAYVSRDTETKQIVLESGALVLSDGGICCIDEFDKMSDSTRSVLHEAMEQQTVSIAKSGIICTLNARTSILAAANPIESRYNPQKSVVENLSLPPTLLSRFDLIYLVLDAPDERNDERLARHIIGLYHQDPDYSTGDVNLEVLTQYISYARKNIHPQLGEEAVRDLVDAYVEMRQIGGNRKTITATPRQLESLIRISEALAKMRFSCIVERADVAEAVRLVKAALRTSATNPQTGQIDMGLITVGRSMATLNRLEDLKKALKDTMIERKLVSFKFHQLYQTMIQNSDVEISRNDFELALRSLEEEEFLMMHGNNSTIRLLQIS